MMGIINTGRVFKYLNTLLLILILLLIQGCTEKDVYLNEVNIKVDTLTAVQIGNDLVTIEHPTSIVTRENELFLFSNENQLIQRLSISEEVILDTITYKKGKGPGELLSPKNFIVNANNYFFTDGGKYSIEIFDSLFRYQQTIQLTSLPVSLSVYKDQFLMTTYVEKGQSKIELFDNKLFKTILIPAESNEILFAVGKGSFINESELLYVRTYSNEVLKINTNNQKQLKRSYNFLPAKSEFQRKQGLAFPEAPLYWDFYVTNETAYLLTNNIVDTKQLLIAINTKNLEINRIFYLDVPVEMITGYNNKIFGYSLSKGQLYKYDVNDQN